jgi:hypothetical protein
LSPAASSRVELHIHRPSVVLGSVRWIGTNSQLDTRLLLDGSLVGRGSSHVLPDNRGVSSFTQNISRAGRTTLQVDNGIHFAIDDLEFEGEPVIPPPSPPTVHINAPVNGSQLDVASIDIGGAVTGQGLVSPVKLTVTFGRPPESTAPPFTSDLALAGTGTTRQFSLPGFGAPLGPIQVTVAAQNSSAQSGAASVTVTNLPTAMADL